jgi:hypothetical protein
MPYAELITLAKSLTEELDTREKEKVTVKWFAGKGEAFAPRIESLKKQYDSIIALSDKFKGLTLKIKMDVKVKPSMPLHEMLTSSYYVEGHDAFHIDVIGKLLNPQDCGRMPSEVQDHIDSLMENLCSDVLGVCPGLEDAVDSFIENLQSVRENLEKEPVDLSVAVKSFLKVKK